jgi:hypothetical protein
MALSADDITAFIFSSILPGRRLAGHRAQYSLWLAPSQALFDACDILPH